MLKTFLNCQKRTREKSLFSMNWLFCMWKSPLQLSLEVSELMSVLLNLAA